MNLTALLTCTIASAIALSAEPTGPTSQPADGRSSGDEIEHRLKQLFESPPKTESDILTRMRADGESFNELIARIDGFLDGSPDDELRDRLLIERLRCLYFAASLGAQPRTRFEQEVRRLISESDSEAIRQEAEYWRLRLDLHDWHALRAIGQGDEADASRRIREFIGRFPHFVAAVPTVEDLILRAWERGSDREAAELLDFLKRHHPGHVTTQALVGRDQVRRAIGRPWRPLLEAVDGQVVEWSSMRGRRVLVVFWAPRHEDSVEMLRFAARLQTRLGPDRLGVVTIALDDDAEAVRDVLRPEAPVGPAAWEKRAWSSDLACRFGICSLPVVLLLDGESCLERCFLPEDWETAQHVQNAIAEMIPPIASPPADSVEPDDSDAASSPAG